MNENVKKGENATENKDWTGLEEWLASEIISTQGKISRAKDIGIICLTLFGSIAVGGLLGVNHAQSQAIYKNDSQWRTTIEQINQKWIDYLSQYDFVTQDGEGVNYYNADIGGNVNNGATDTQAEE